MNIYPGKVTTFAGSGTNATVDGTGTAASFKNMGGATVVGGFAYVMTVGAVRKVALTGASAGAVTTLAGSSTLTGCTASTDPAAVRFSSASPPPTGQLVGQLDSDGTYLYVWDTGCGVIDRVSLATGATSILTSSVAGPLTVAVAPGGVTYVYVASSNTITQVDPVSGTTSTFYTFPATYSSWTGITSDSSNIWVIRAYTPSQPCGNDLLEVPLNGGSPTSFTAPGPCSSMFGDLGGLISAGDYLYASSPDPGSGFKDTRLERITKSDGTVVYVAGTPASGYKDNATGTDVWFGRISGVASDGTNLWVDDSVNYRFRQVVPGTALASSQSPNDAATVNIYPGKVTTFAGSGTNATVDGTGTAASFKDMGGATVVGGFAYVMTVGAIRKVALTGGSAGAVTTLAGSSTQTGCTASADPAAVRFSSASPPPSGQNLGQLDSDGTYLYVWDTGCAVIDRVSLATGATSLVTSVTPGPLTVAVTPGGKTYLYVAFSNTITQVDPVNGTTSTFYTFPAYYHSWTGITSDASALWVIRAYVPSSPCGNDLLEVPLNGGSPTSFTAPGTCSSMFGDLGGLISAGNYLYGSSPGDTRVERITKHSGAVGSIAGSSSGDFTAEWTDAHFGLVTGVVSDGTTLWVPDAGDHKLRQITFAALRAQEFGPTSSQDGSTPTTTAGDPVNMGTGNYYDSFTDVSMPGIGMDFSLTRYFNSLDAAPNMGANRFANTGWTDSFDASVEVSGDGAFVYMPTGQVLKYISDGHGGYTRQLGVYDTLTSSGGLFTLTEPDGTLHHFDQNGQLSDITDRNGNVIRLHYTAPGPWGRVDYITDTVGRQINFSYNTCGEVSRVTLPDGRYVEYVYTLCQLTTVYELDADGQNRKYTTYGYSGSEISSVNDGLGNVTYNTYNLDGRLYQQQTATTTTTWDYPSDTTRTVTRNGHVWTYTYSNIGVLQSVKDPSDNTTTFSNFDQNYNPQTTSRPGGQAWTYTYDLTYGVVLTVTPPSPLAGSVLTYTYGNASFPTFPTAAKDGRGNYTNYSYDAEGNLTCASRATASLTGCTSLGQSMKTTYGYDVNHELHTITDPNNDATTYDYFGSTSNPQKKGLLQGVTSKTGLHTTFDYNSYLQRTSMVTPQGNANGGGSAYTWLYGYDEAGRLMTATDPLGDAAATYGYDAEGNLISTTDADHHVRYTGYYPGGTVCFESVGVSTSCGSNASGITSYTYDADGSLATVTDGDLHTTPYAYWPNGELKSVTDPLSRVWSYTQRSFTATSSSVTETMSSTDTIATTIDPMNRPTDITYNHSSSSPGIDATAGQHYAYDSSGNLCYAATGASSVTCSSTGGTKLTYDADSRLSAAGGFTYGYDSAGNLSRRTYPDASNVAYTYDGDNRLCGIVYVATPASTCSAGTINWDYSKITNAPSKLTKNFTNGQSITTFDEAGRFTDLVNKYGSTLGTLSIFNPTLDAAGFPQSVAVTNNGLATALQTETQTYSFDPTTARLTKVCYDGGLCGSGSSVTGDSYAYDGAGNILSKTTYGSTPGTSYYGYDSSNQLCWAGSTSGSGCTTPSGDATYLYTANGGRRSDGTTSMHYDLAGRLTSATSGSTTDAYSYDDLGNRSKDTGATTTNFTWDPNAPVAQLATTSAGSTTDDFFYGQGLQAMKSGSTTYYYDRDQVGSTANVLKGNATMEYSYSYQPYGTFRSDKKNDSAAATNFNPMVFDSEYRDLGTTGNIDLRARMYDPATGSFLQPDPAGQFLSYTFADDRPTVMSDPSGLFSWKWVAVGVVVAALAVGAAFCIAATEGICAPFVAAIVDRTVALDTDAIIKFDEPGVQDALEAGDRLVATPNVVSELESFGIKDMESFLGSKGIDAVSAEPGASIPATFLAQQLDAVAPSIGNAGDALNIAEAGSIDADLFVTADSSTIGRTFGSGSIFLPFSGGITLPFVVAP